MRRVRINDVADPRSLATAEDDVTFARDGGSSPRLAERPGEGPLTLGPPRLEEVF